MFSLTQDKEERFDGKYTARKLRRKTRYCCKVVSFLPRRVFLSILFISRRDISLESLLERKREREIFELQQTGMFFYWYHKRLGTKTDSLHELLIGVAVFAERTASAVSARLGSLQSGE